MNNNKDKCKMTVHVKMYDRSKDAPKYVPLNRHLLVHRRPKKEAESTGILLPEGYKKTESRYEVVTVESVAPNCAFLDRVRTGVKIVVLSNFLEDIEIAGHMYTVVLENHVMGVIGIVGE
jgi:co-chaperonin GroES (HSP10)